MRKHLPLIVILGIAAIARYWAIDFCLPSLLCRPDEEAVASVATGFFARDPNPHFFDWPPVFMYAVTLAMVAYFQYARYTGWIRSEFRFLQSISVDPSPLVLAARLMSAAAGTATVWVMYRLARRLFDGHTALVASGFLALAYLHVRDSHFGVTDVTAILFVMVTLLCGARLAERVTPSDLVLAGAMTGLAAATKYNAGAVALPVLWILTSNPHRDSLRTILARSSSYLAVSAGVFLVLSPFSLIEYPSFLRSLDSVSSHLMGGHGPDIGRGWWVHLTSTLRHGVGTPMLLFGVAGLTWMTWRSPRIGIMVALFPFTTYVLIGPGLTVFARYALPIVPFLCLGAAFTVLEASRLLAARLGRPASAQPLAWAAAALIVWPSAHSVWQFDRLLSIDDSRVVAARWIQERFPAGATIAATERRFDRLSFPPVGSGEVSPYTITEWSGEMAEPDVIVVTESPLHPEGMPDYLAGVLSRYERAMETSGPERPGSHYDWQDEFYIPLAGIDHLERPGPRITILTRR